MLFNSHSSRHKSRYLLHVITSVFFPLVAHLSRACSSTFTQCVRSKSFSSIQLWLHFALHSFQLQEVSPPLESSTNVNFAPFLKYLFSCSGLLTFGSGFLSLTVGVCVFTIYMNVNLYFCSTILLINSSNRGL